MYLEYKKIINDKNKFNHLLFEDDNIENLKYLQKEYTNKIDFIYIDPPYNTGKNFVYKDKKDNWLEFMKERLQIAYTLMKDKSFMFISIDDYSFSELKLLCDEIFKTKYFKKITPFIRKTSSGGRNSSLHISCIHDYILVYQKNESKELIGFKSPEMSKTIYPLTDSRGVYKLRSMKRDNSNKNENMDYDLVNPMTGKIYRFELGWRWGKEKVDWGIKNNYIVFKEDKDGIDSVYFKEYRDFDNEGNPFIRNGNIESILNDFPNSLGTNDLKNILNLTKCPFNNPKPVELIKYLIKISNLKKDAIILDFFAGSGTTAQAVLELNNSEDTNYKFILCTNNENNICKDITYKRIEHLLTGYVNLKGENISKVNENIIFYIRD